QDARAHYSQIKKHTTHSPTSHPQAQPTQADPEKHELPEVARRNQPHRLPPQTPNSAPPNTHKKMPEGIMPNLLQTTSETPHHPLLKTKKGQHPVPGSTDEPDQPLACAPHTTSKTGLSMTPQKGGDPAAPSGTATLLRLRPNRRPHLHSLPPHKVGLGHKFRVLPTFMT